MLILLHRPVFLLLSEDCVLSFQSSESSSCSFFRLYIGWEFCIDVYCTFVTLYSLGEWQNPLQYSTFFLGNISSSSNHALILEKEGLASGSASQHVCSKWETFGVAYVGFANRNPLNNSSRNVTQSISTIVQGDIYITRVHRKCAEEPVNIIASFV